MSGLSTYQFNPLVSGGIEVSKSTNIAPVRVVLEAGMTSSLIPLWSCTPLTEYRFEDVIIDPTDIDTDAGDEATWVTLRNAQADGSAGTAASPGAQIVLGTVGPTEDVYYKYFMQATIPSGTANQIKVDVKLRQFATKRPETT